MNQKFCYTGIIEKLELKVIDDIISMFLIVCIGLPSPQFKGANAWEYIMAIHFRSMQVRLTLTFKVIQFLGVYQEDTQ